MIFPLYFENISYKSHFQKTKQGKLVRLIGFPFMDPPILIINQNIPDAVALST